MKLLINPIQGGNVDIPCLPLGYLSALWEAPVIDWNTDPESDIEAPDDAEVFASVQSRSWSEAKRLLERFLLPAGNAEPCAKPKAKRAPRPRTRRTGKFKGNIGILKINGMQFIDTHPPRPHPDRLSLPGQLVRAFPRVFYRGEHRRYLIDFPTELM